MERINKEIRDKVITEVKSFLHTHNYYDYDTYKLPRGIDLSAKKGGLLHYFAISVLSPNEEGECLGSTNTSEWRFAEKRKGRTHFVIVSYHQDHIEDIDILEPQDILGISVSITFKALFKARFNNKGKVDLAQPHKYTIEDIQRLLK